MGNNPRGEKEVGRWEGFHCFWGNFAQLAGQV